MNIHVCVYVLTYVCIVYIYIYVYKILYVYLNKCHLHMCYLKYMEKKNRRFIKVKSNYKQKYR